MRVNRESFGFVVEIYRPYKTDIRLTFEEVYTRRVTSRKRFYCTVDIGLLYKNEKQEVLGSFEIDDWFNFKLHIKKRNKLKRLLGVSTYNELVSTVEHVSNGSYNSKKVLV